MGLVLCISGITYAYLRTSKAQTNQNDINSLTCLEMSFIKEENEISLENAYAITDEAGKASEPFKFTIKNNCSISVYANINLETINNNVNGLAKEHVKYYLKLIDDNEEALGLLSAAGSAEATLNNTTSNKLYENIEFDGLEEKEFELTLWVDYDTTAEEGMNKAYSGKVVVTVSPNPAGEKYYEITLSKSNLSSIGYTDNVVPNELIIPEKYEFAPHSFNKVTSIEDYAFNEESNLTGDLVIPRSVKTIGEYAFYKTNITGLTLNEGLESIENCAFYLLSSLTGHLVIPSSVKAIGSETFRETSITGLILNEGLESIGNFAFRSIVSLTGHLVIPGSVKAIGSETFRETSITGLTLNEGLEEIGTSSFYNIKNLTGTIIIPTTVKSIGSWAFEGTNINNLILNEGLESIGDRAFGSVKSLNVPITIPNTVKSIGAGAFNGTGITTVNYRGTQAQWNAITKGTSAFPSGVTINYNYTGA